MVQGLVKRKNKFPDVATTFKSFVPLAVVTLTMLPECEMQSVGVLANWHDGNQTPKPAAQRVILDFSFHRFDVRWSRFENFSLNIFSCGPGKIHHA